jgi:hypothetical protein
MYLITDNNLYYFKKKNIRYYITKIILKIKKEKIIEVGGK